MKRILLMICHVFLFHVPAGSVEKPDSSLVMFWNLENFFDHIDQGTGESDKEFSSFGGRHWTRKRFDSKCDAVAKAVFHLGDVYGKLPDVIGVAEIENRGVLSSLTGRTLLRKCGYGIIHYDSSDRRGIDVALLYRKECVSILSVSLKGTVYDGEWLRTRDILHVRAVMSYGDTLDFIVNHHPSKYGGAKESEGRRTAVMNSLMELCDSLGSDRIIAMGDFNDTPDAASFGIIGERLVNKASTLFEKGEGTIRHEGRWELIDMFLVSPGMDSRTSMKICKVPFLMKWDRKHPGFRPFRTYSGPRHIGGVSDHCPVILKVFR